MIFSSSFSNRSTNLSSCFVRMLGHHSCAVNRRLHFTDTRLRSKVVVCWLPNIADFFFSLCRLIEDLERQLSSASYDSSEFLFWRRDEYKRTLANLSSRYCETYGCLEIGKLTRVYCSDSLGRLMSMPRASVLL